MCTHFFSSNMEIPNFMRPLYGFSEYSFSLFLLSDTVLWDSTPENFANI